MLLSRSSDLFCLRSEISYIKLITSDGFFFLYTKIQRSGNDGYETFYYAERLALKRPAWPLDILFTQYLLDLPVVDSVEMAAVGEEGAGEIFGDVHKFVD